MNSFEYYKPVSLKEAAALKKRYGGSAALLSGGTDLILAMDSGAGNPEAVIDLKGITELKTIKSINDSVLIGAGTTFSELIKSRLIKESLPILWEAANLVASVSVRNTATLAGNIANAVPSAESASPLLARDAAVIAESETGKREVPITGFFKGPRKSSLKNDEIITAVRIPHYPGKFGECYIKMGRYDGEDLAQAGVSVSVDPDNNFKIAFAAVGPVPLRIIDAEEIIRGKELTDELIIEAEEMVLKRISPITDIRASMEYRLHMCGVMLKRALKASVSRRDSGVPEYGKKLI